jgi:hypothetical protein
MTQTAHVQLVHQQGQAGDKLRLRTWIEVQLVGEDDKPIPYQQYVVTLPGGATRSGTLDEEGKARIDGIPAGTCKVSFPDLDKDVWAPVEAEQ